MDTSRWTELSLKNTSTYKVWIRSYWVSLGQVKLHYIARVHTLHTHVSRSFNPTNYKTHAAHKYTCITHHAEQTLARQFQDFPRICVANNYDNGTNNNNNEYVERSLAHTRVHARIRAKRRRATMTKTTNERRATNKGAIFGQKQRARATETK